MNKLSLLIAGGMLWLSSCNSPPPLPENIGEMNSAPAISEMDLRYQGVFSMLDGKWEGVFAIYKDSLGQRQGAPQPTIQDLEFSDMSLKLVQEVEVQQEYISESPYFQRVTIQDTYFDEIGNTRTITSHGVNKVQNGQLWCIVQKPDEKIIHSGTRINSQTLTWRRELRNPLKIEYFYETVESDYYKIIGWGYYDGDDPGIAPRTWFVGDYTRVD